MGEGYTVDPAELRKHAGDIDSLKERFAAVKAASAHIAQDDQAYGVLCGWISGILEGRHTRQDELIAYVEENLDIVARELRETAADYEARDANTADAMNKIKDGMPG
jgi:excreted virulence factor EspC (type VII ESX diderm)